tara:strand:+ start:205 stop:420 length:216 start_codon:yes stop_codon:yes gene_type:complete
MEDKDLVKVEGEQSLFRDKNTGAILNTDSAGYAQYMRMKQRKQTEREELDTIKSDIEEIKSLLRELANGSK